VHYLLFNVYNLLQNLNKSFVNINVTSLFFILPFIVLNEVYDENILQLLLQLHNYNNLHIEGQFESARLAILAMRYKPFVLSIIIHFYLRDLKQKI